MKSLEDVDTHIQFLSQKTADTQIYSFVSIKRSLILCAHLVGMEVIHPPTLNVSAHICPLQPRP